MIEFAPLANNSIPTENLQNFAWIWISYNKCRAFQIKSFLLFSNLHLSYYHTYTLNDHDYHGHNHEVEDDNDSDDDNNRDDEDDTNWDDDDDDDDKD